MCLCMTCGCFIPRSNFLGTSFTLFNSGVNPNKRHARWYGSNVREELAAAHYVSAVHHTCTHVVIQGRREKGEGAGTKREREGGKERVVESTCIYSCEHTINVHTYASMYMIYCNCNMFYAENLGFKCPRKLTIIIPALSQTRERRTVTPRRVSVI